MVRRHGRRAGRESALMIIMSRQDVEGWEHAPDVWLNRQGEHGSTREHSRWLPGWSLVPTVLVTPHAGLRERCSLYTLRQTQPEHRQPEHSTQQGSHGSQESMASPYVQCLVPQVHTIHHVPLVVACSSFHSCKREQCRFCRYSHAWHPGARSQAYGGARTLLQSGGRCHRGFSDVWDIRKYGRFLRLDRRRTGRLG